MIRISVCVIALVLAACSGGTKLIKDAPAPPADKQIASGSNAALSATLDWVIVRNGYGAWARNADWDEYLIRVHNTSTIPMRITRTSVTDSSGHASTPLAERKALVKQTRKTVKRYRDDGIKVKAGSGGGTLIAAGAGTTALGVGMVYAEAASQVMSTAATTSTGVGAATGALLIGGPVLVGYGIVRVVRNAKVDNRIGQRNTEFPLTLAAGEGGQLDVFFPISPAPSQLDITYEDEAGTHTLVLDTRQVLAGLHLPESAPPVATAAAVSQPAAAAGGAVPD